VRAYPRLDIKTFGLHLLESGDLDPIYIALSKFDDEDQVKRWLVAYWCLYHAGASSWLSERTGAEFWGNLFDAAENVTPAPPGDRWPRGHERRHWRAKNATTAVDFLSANFATPERFVDFVSNDGKGGHFAEIATRARTVPGNGPWIAFKIGDMLERVLGVPVDFKQAEVFMFDTPREAALLLWRKTLGLSEHAKPKDLEKTLTDVVCFVGQMFPAFMAPPHYDRPLGLQEIETVLCKWKSHLSGHYPLNNDIIDIRNGIGPWLQHSTTAAMFLQNLPQPATSESS